MKLFKRILPFLLCICLLTPLASASAAGAKVVFSATSPDANGLFTVDVTAYNATFDTFQYSFNFDKAVVTPASWSTGTPAADFASFAKISANISDAMYEGFMPANSGLINTVGLNVSAAYTAGVDGLLLFSYRFKKIADGAAGIALATSQSGKQYNSVLPTGGQLLRNDTVVATSYVFVLPAALTGGKGDEEQTTDTEMTKAERAQNTIILQIGNYAAAKDGALCHIYPGEKQVTPYVKADSDGNGRAMVPVRFVGEQLGAAVDFKDNVVTVTLGGTTIKMTIGSSTYTVNGVTKTMDTAAELKDIGDGSGNGRVMVPIRFVIEALGKAVYWDKANSLVVVTEPDVPWQADRSAEQDLTSDVLLVISPLLRDTIQ